MDSYLKQPVMVIVGDLDQMVLYNDFYGQKTGDEMLLSFASALRKEFGEEHSYRYGGDEIICVALRLSEEEVLARIEKCREGLRHRTFNGHTLSLSCSFGYAYGMPGTAREFQELLRLADIYAHSAHRRGQGYTVGGPCDEAHMRAAVTQNVIVSHARARAENQLSGLLSVSAFVTAAKSLLEQGLDFSRSPVVGFFHIIHFRDFNEEYGYARGDALISYTAKLLQQSFPDRYICNITGPQFGILCYEDEAESGLKITSDGLMSYSKDYPIVTKCGFAPFREGESVMSILDKAKAAHDAIYSHPSVFVCWYNETMDASSHFRQYIVSHVDEAIEKGWLKVYYQPIVRAVNGEICNEEALSRWDDPTYGFLSPVQFIPILEECHLLYKVTLHVVRRTLEDFRVKEAKGISPVPVSINFSRYDFEECDMVQAVTDLVDRSGYSRSMIRVEITESAFTENQELLQREVVRFRENGFEVWMDDFGSEYSTLNMLRQLDFDLIKIDMEFMRDFSASGKNMIIVSNVINMARKMGVSTLVEGIETEEHYRTLQRLGCEKLQGYLFSRPAALENLIEWVSSSGALQYESVKEASYYDAIGSLDLNALSVPDTPPVPGGAPVGVLEYQNQTFSCLRGTDVFYQALQELGLLSVSRMGTNRQSLTAPESLSRAASQCLNTSEWVELEITNERGQRMTVRLRQISRNMANESVALLVTLLPVGLNGRI